MEADRTPLRWRALTDDDLAAIAALAARCLAVDGGLPLTTAEPFLRGRFAGEGVVGRAATDAAGTLVAAAAVRPQQADGVRRAVLSGLVDPAHRGRGLGSELLDWGLATAATLGDGVTVETEALTEAGRRLLRRRGLGQVFAEDVMRFDLDTTPLPPAHLPAGVTLSPWRPESPARFFAVYEQAFRERPGFPGWSAQQWADWTSGEDEFRPEWSLLATDPVAGDIGFVTCADGWIVQVGTVPAVPPRPWGGGCADGDGAGADAVGRVRRGAARRQRGQSGRTALRATGVRGDRAAGALRSGRVARFTARAVRRRG